MKASVWIVAWAALIASASMTQAQDLDTKAERALERALKTADKLEADVSLYEGEERSYSDSVGERALDKVEGAAKKLAELPADHPRVAALLERLDSLRARLARLVDEKGSLGARSGLDSKAAGKLNHLATTLENLETELGHHGPDGKYAFNDRNRERFEGKLVDAGKKLAELPAENPTVGLLRTHLERLEAQLAAMGSNLEEAQAKAAAAAAERARLEALPEFERDAERLGAVVGQLKKRGMISFDAPYLRRNLRTLSLTEAEELAASWPENRRTFAALAEKYAALRGGRPTSMVLLLIDGEFFCAEFAAAAEAFVGGAPAKVAEFSEQVRRLTAAAVAEQRHGDFVDLGSELNTALGQVRHIAHLARALSEGSTDLTPAAAALQGEVDRAMDGLAGAIVAANRAPADVYAGADKGALEAFARETWAKHFAAERVLAVRFPEDAFRRTVAWRWDTIRKEYYKVDHSELWITVAVESGEEAILYRCVIRKMHLEQDRLTFAWDRPERVAPTQRMLAKNLD
ncbi:MAG: hypothetical protein KDD82_28330 [Planctomycetes bacterium]|nr:hypothetical protein [Planctomycetota bacterium]